MLSKIVIDGEKNKTASVGWNSTNAVLKFD